MNSLNTIVPTPVLVKKFSDIGRDDIRSVGGKNASLGEMFSHLGSAGVKVPDGFATTAAAYWKFLDDNHIRSGLAGLMANLDTRDFHNLDLIASQARQLIMAAHMPEDIRLAVISAYHQLAQGEKDVEVAVRSSATAEDLPGASFAGQHESYLNIRGTEKLLHAVQRCYASLFTARAIRYRHDGGFRHMDVALSVGVQKMVRADKACSGVIFTLEPESGFRDIIHITGTWGLGENIVQGVVSPDEFLVFKPTLRAGKNAIVSKKLGEKSKTMIYASSANGNGDSTLNIETPREKREQFVLSNADILTLAGWSLAIETHYGQPMDIEWARDGISSALYIVQARPETVHSRKDPFRLKEYRLSAPGQLICSGEAIGNKITSGVVRVLTSPAEAHLLMPGEILVTEITSPDWDPIMHKASAIITSKGGRTSHASIVARELGLVAVVGAAGATEKLRTGQQVTVSCAGGKTAGVYEGLIPWTEEAHDLRNISLPETRPMLIVGDPAKAFGLSFYPNMGVGLMRIEFIISNAVRVHPMALVNFNTIKDENVKKQIRELTANYPSPEKYFVEKLSQAVATIACAFYPKEVIVRMSDFKTNEYAGLLGGSDFEPAEENPMIGFRGASRYYNERYREGFRLECEAMKMVRNNMGLTNVKLMIPFCRTPEEGRKVVDLMAGYGLRRGENGLEIYVMAEIPSNVLLAEEFAEIFDGFSVGSNDLTQLTLGIDRDSAIISDLFDERNPASKKMISMLIQKARACGKKTGLCGQAPSDHEEFAAFLVNEGIGSISFNPDALLKGISNMKKAEAETKAKKRLPAKTRNKEVQAAKKYQNLS